MSTTLPPGTRSPAQLPAGLRTSLEIRSGSQTQGETTPLERVHLSRDLPRDVVAAQVRAGRWARLRPGVYVPTELVAKPGYAAARRRSVATARAVALLAPPDRTVSHASAALLHGLPTWSLPTVTHLSQPVTPRVRRGDDVVRHVVHVPDAERVVIDGLAVTSLERTVVDCLCSLRPHDALVLTDAALRRAADLTMVVRMLARRRGRRGVRQAWTILDLADAGAESPGESMTRYIVLAGGLPRPQTQLHRATSEGDYWSDLGWRDVGLHLEYDGLAKYADPRTVVRERRRDEAVRNAGGTMLHVRLADLETPERLVVRVRRELVRLGHRGLSEPRRLVQYAPGPTSAPSPPPN